MSSITDQFGEIGANLERALKEHAETIADHRARFADQQNQIGAMNISVLSMREEVLGRIEASEIKVLQALAAMHEDIRAIKRQGANGHG